MITRPLELQSHLRTPSSRLNPLPLLDVLFIVLFFSILGSNFVLSPGLTIDLPTGDEGKMAGLRADAVLTVQTDEMLFFQGRILNLGTIQDALEEHVERRGNINLIIRFDRKVSVQTLLSVSELAREAGVARVQLAADSEQDDPGPETVFP